MQRRISACLLVICVSLASAPAIGEDAPPENGEKQVAGMSILGNDEAPKSLVIVPWKSSDLGTAVSVAKGLDAGRDPVDRKSFTRAVDYYEIRAGETH
jgi:hypothetical protein